MLIDYYCYKRVAFLQKFGCSKILAINVLFLYRKLVAVNSVTFFLFNISEC
jgi:hypothetical protein